MTNKTLAKPTAEMDIFDITGGYGPWQRKVYVLFFAVNVIGIWQNFAVTFLAPNMDYWCVPPSISNNGTFSSIIATNTSNHCHVLIAEPTSGNESQVRSIPCTRWKYNTTEYSRTIVNEWNLVCERDWLVSFAKSIYMIGFMTSVFLFGHVSDSLGRFPTVLVCYIITCTSSIAAVFSTSYTMFVILRFFSAFGRTGMTTTGYVILMEIVGPEWRTKLGVTIQYGWAVGIMTLPALAYFIRTWYWFQLAIALPTIPLVYLYWVVPESPRWLMTQGKKEQFLQVVTRAAEQNGRELDEDSLMSFVAQKFANGEERAKSKTILDLVKTPMIRKRTLYTAILWMVNAFIYYALSYNTNDLGGNPYINFFISGVVEFISYTAVYFSITWLGRKIPLIGGMMIGGAACAAIMAVPPNLLWLTITFSMIGKMFITATFGLLYIYTTEMFPTVIRNISVGTCSTCARIGSIIAPFVRELERATHYTVPYGINAALAISSSLLVFGLPETKDRNIPDTMEEGRTFGEESTLVVKHPVAKS